MCFQIDYIKRFPSNHVNYSQIMSTEGTHSKKERKARAVVKNVFSFQQGSVNIVSLAKRSGVRVGGKVYLYGFHSVKCSHFLFISNQIYN